MTNTTAQKNTQNKNTTQKSKQHKIQKNKTTLVQSSLGTTLGQDTRWVYYTAVASPHGARM